MVTFISVTELPGNSISGPLVLSVYEHDHWKIVEMNEQFMQEFCYPMLSCFFPFW